MLRRHAIPAILGLTTLAAAGCMHVPLHTAYKLATFDTLTADPAHLRAAVRYPAALVARRDGVKLTLTIGQANGAPPRVHTFVLQEVTDTQERHAVARYGRTGDIVAAYRLSVEDGHQVRLLQLLARDAQRQGKSRGQSGLAVAAAACHRGGLPAGPIRVSTYLKLDPADGYLPVIEDLDLRQQFGAEVLAKEVPPCTDATQAR